MVAAKLRAAKSSSLFRSKSSSSPLRPDLPRREDLLAYRLDPRDIMALYWRGREAEPWHRLTLEKAQSQRDVRSYGQDPGKL
jgi:hypothetical protein